MTLQHTAAMAGEPGAVRHQAGAHLQLHLPGLIGVSTSCVVGYLIALAKHLV